MFQIIVDRRMEKIYKSLLITFCSASVLLGFTACGEENKIEQVDYEISVSQDDIEFTHRESSVVLEVITDAPSWGYTDNISWLEIAKTVRGLSLTAESNMEPENREGTIMIYAMTDAGEIGKRIEVKVRQDGRGAAPEGMVPFEDDTFMDWMLSYYDVNQDGYLSAEEALAVKKISVGFDETVEGTVPVKSLKGIEYCKNLEELECDFNAITSLDLSGLSKLTYVDCSYNLLKEVKLTGCTSLAQYYGNVNEDLESLDFKDCPNIQMIQAYKNSLRKFDASGFKQLVYLDVSQNFITSLDITECPELKIVNCGTNNLETLNLKDIPVLMSLGCYNNKLSALDLSSVSELSFLECYSNSISSLDLSANKKMATLRCDANMIETLNIEGCLELSSFNCSSNRIKGGMDLSAFSNLAKVNVGGNFISSLNVSGCSKITALNCSNSDLSELDVTTLVEMTELNCSSNNLKELDLSANAKLEKVIATKNPLEKLWLAKGQYIGDLSVDNPDVITEKE